MIGVIFATLFQGILFAIVVIGFLGGLLRKMGIITITSAKTAVTWTVILMVVYFFIAIGNNIGDYNTDQKAAEVVGTWKSGKHILSFSEEARVFNSDKPGGNTRYQISVNEGIVRIYKSMNSSKYDDYEYKISWGKLTLVDSAGKKTKYKRTSSKYKGDELYQNPFSDYSLSLSEDDDISGAYVDTEGGKYVLLKRTLEDDPVLGLFESSEYELYKLDQTLDVDNFEEGYILSFNHYFEHNEKDINHRAYIANVTSMDRIKQELLYPYYYGLNSDKSELHIWRPDYAEEAQSPFDLTLTLKEAYSIDELIQGENEIINQNQNKLSTTDSNKENNMYKQNQDFNVERVMNHYYTNGTDENCYEIYFYVEDGQIYFTMSRYESNIISDCPVEIIDSNTLNFKSEEIGWDLDFVWDNDDTFVATGQGKEIEDMMGSEFFDTSIYSNAS